MRVLLIANAKSGTQTDVAEVEARLRAGGAEVRTCPVEDAGGADVSGLDRIVVAGGDGSIGRAARLAAEHDLPLAVVPTGTANDFARALDLPQDPEAAAQLAADPAARTRRVEIARTGDTTFLNAASAGLSVAAAEEAEAHKSRFGALAYAIGAVKAGLRARAQPVRVDVDGESVFDGRAWQVVVGATGRFGAGSGMGETEQADGRLDVAVVPSGSRLGLVRRAYAMKRGALSAQQGVTSARGGEIVVAGPGTFNVDGEVRDCGTRARFAVDGSVEVVVP